MKTSARKILAGLPTLLLLPLLLLAGASRALPQQPAPKAATPTNQTPATQPQKTDPANRDVKAQVNETTVDSSIADDPAVTGMLATFAPKVRELEIVIGKLKGELKKGGAGAGSMGNFIADGMRAQAIAKTGGPVALALMNGGGIRRNTIGEGELRARDIFELLPFENALVTLELNGEQLKTLLEMIVATREAQSGARVVYRTNADKKQEMESAKLRDAQNREIDIDPKGTYTIVTIDYLYKVGGDRYGILQQGKNMKELGITLRDAVIAYVKSETAAGRDIKSTLDGRFSFDRAGSAGAEVPPQ